MLVKIETFAGWFIGEVRGNGWLVNIKDYEVDPETPPDQIMQRSVCPDTGEAFIKPFDGRYRDLSDEEQEECLKVMREMVDTLSGRSIPDNEFVPVWVQAEFLENVVDFELHPPCGCEPTRWGGVR